MSAALISQMDPPPGQQAEFDAWYSDEHVPARMRLAGFQGAVRARAVQGEPSHLVVYYMDDLGALDSPQYVELKTQPTPLTARMLSTVAAFTRFTGREIYDSGDAEPGRYLYLVTFDVPAEFQADFDRWYETDHIPLLLRNDSWLRCRRYDIVSGDPESVTRAAVHELADQAALDSPERAEARATPWRAELAHHDWFATARYAVYERFQDFRAEPTKATARCRSLI